MFKYRKKLRILKIIVILGVVAVAGFILLKINSNLSYKLGFGEFHVAPLNLGNEIIQFTHTDDNSGEDIIIKSDKEIYEGGNVSDVYFSLTNTSKQSQKIAILAYFPKEYGDLNYIDVWQSNPTSYQLPATSSPQPSWQRLPLTRGDVRANITKLAKAWERKKPVPEEYDVTAGTQFEIPAGHTAYFRTEITYPYGKRGEFWFEAFGDQGGYGLLDPIFVGGGIKLGTSAGSDVAPGWFQTGGVWDYRRKITIDETKVSGTSNLSNFPTLINLTYGDLRHTSFSGKVASSSAGVTGGGGDFVFTSSDGTTKLDHEIEKYSSSSGELWAWVEVPTLSVTADTSIYVYYGGPSSGATNQNPTGVWDTNYKGVWHSSESLATTSVLDSTSNNTDGTATDLDTSEQVPGKIGGNFDYSFGADAEYINLGTSDPIDNLSEMTYSAWIHARTTGGSNAARIIEKTGTEPQEFNIYRTGANDTTAGIAMTISTTGAHGIAQTTGGSIQMGRRYYVVGTYSDSGDRVPHIYIDGVESTYNSTTVANSIISSSAGNAAIGARISDTAVGWVGQIDEIRVSNSIRSADWIKTEYNNQFKPSTFYSVGGLQYRIPNTTKLGTSAGSDIAPSWFQTGGVWDYRRKITIDETKVSGTSNLSNFPTLVYLNYADLKHTSFSGKVASSSAGVTGGGGDFVFTSSNGTTKLDHEIEKYSSSSGELWAWVEVPTLSVTQDTSIYVYYGGPSTGATNQNVTGVWDSNYVGVWHMKEDPAVAGTNGVRDSTSNGNHGTDAGSMNAADQVTGRIGGGLDFDGTDDRIENSLTSNVTPLTISAWIKADTGGEGNSGRIVAKASQFLFSLDFDASGPVDKEFGLYRYFSGTDGFWSAPTNTISLGEWEYVVVTYASEETTENAVLYNNGVSVFPTEEFTPTSIADTNTNKWIFGSIDTVGNNAFDGIIDEVRISNTARSADWIKTEYNNQFKPSTFYSVGGLQKRN